MGVTRVLFWQAIGKLNPGEIVSSAVHILERKRI
ncbi:MAG: hypothetical protein Ct9H300mP28_02680 [Pseudomonadota bacterium]|nr:MAG: hypothetical protein Ct9H300mP28_02680 [Pseudomonadota bacterium]